MITLQIAGSIAILVGFALVQMRKIDSAALPYLLVNAIGSVALGVPAVVTGQWGFVLLESSWLLISLYGMLRLVRSGLPSDTALVHKRGAEG